MTNFYLKLFLLFFGINITISQTSEISSIGLIKNYLKDLGMNHADIEDLRVDTETFSKSMNVTNVYVSQYYNGIPIKNSIGSFALQNGKVVSYAGSYIREVSSKINATSYSISPQNAVISASISLGLEVVNEVTVIENELSNANSFVLSNENISSENIPALLVYELKDNKLILCWNLDIHSTSSSNIYSVSIDANTNELVSENNLVLHCSFDNHSYIPRKRNTSSVLENKLATSSMLMTPSYSVFALPIESPNHGKRSIVSGKEDIVASPFGWHDTDGVAGAEHTTTRGNNVYASEDMDANNIPGNQPDGGANLIFDYPYDPTAKVMKFQDASLTNLFYVNNVMHDVWYKYGFDEMSGNFQVNNYGKGGFEKDEVLADSQDGSGENNANFSTPSDGKSPRMQMYLYNPSTYEFRVISNT